MTPQHKIRLPNGGEVHICSMWRAQMIHPGYDWVVSLLDPPNTKPGFSASNHHIYRVDDTEHPGPEDWLLSENDVKFLTSLKVPEGGKGLVHCHAGISRSTAMGSMIAFNNGATVEDIVSGLDWSIADPNQLILGWSKKMCGEDLCKPLGVKFVKELQARYPNY